MQSQNFKIYIDNIDKIDRLYIRCLEAIRLLDIDKTFDNLIGLKLKLFLTILKYSLNKVFDN